MIRKILKEGDLILFRDYSDFYMKIERIRNLFRYGFSSWKEGFTRVGVVVSFFKGEYGRQKVSLFTCLGNESTIEILDEANLLRLIKFNKAVVLRPRNQVYTISEYINPNIPYNYLTTIDLGYLISTRGSTLLSKELGIPSEKLRANDLIFTDLFIKLNI
jgi:hypothetical protein